MSIEREAREHAIDNTRIGGDPMKAIAYALVYIGDALTPSAFTVADVCPTCDRELPLPAGRGGDGLCDECAPEPKFRKGA